MDWLEILIPLIILAVYFFGGLAGRNKGAAEDEPDPRTMTAEEAQAQAEQERVQAEIRAQILERRRQAEAAFEEKRRQAAGNATPVPQVVNEARASRPMHRPTNIPQAPAHPGRPERPADPVFSWEENRAHQNPFAEQMAARQQQIAETEKQAAALRSQLGLAKPNAKSSKVAAPKRSVINTPRLGSSLNRNVRSLLAQPASVRTAIVLAEIIDQPVSLRTKDRKI
jgi:Na+-transporting methylmalonyl-CoA/oxaloacetate decarboxylase gamma subunit